MSEFNLSSLSPDQISQLMESISTIQRLTSNTLIPERNNATSNSPLESENEREKTSVEDPNTKDSEPQTIPLIEPPPLSVTKNSSSNFLEKRNITLPIMSKLAEFKTEIDPNSNILSKINESLSYLQEIYQEIGLSEDELTKSESYLMGRLSDLIQKAAFTKQNLNLEIMTIMNNISEIDDILTKRFKYDYIIDGSIKETVAKFQSRFKHSISSDELTVILLELNPTCANLLELKEKLISVFDQLLPRFTNKVIDLSNKTLKFYEYYNKIDNYTLQNSQLLKQIPSLEEANIYNNESNFKFEQVDHLINNTIYKEISHTLFTDIDGEVAHLKTELQKRIQTLFKISKDSVQLYADLFIEERNSKVLYLSELAHDADQADFENLVDLVHHNAGLKQKNIEELQNLKESLVKEKEMRETNLSKRKTLCQQLWFRLNQDAAFVNEFLKENNDLKLTSLRNFELEVERLNELKLKNIASFIEESRSKIQESWDLLMYTTEERHRQFPLFFDEEETDYTEKFLDSHNEYFDRLCAEIEALKPILNQIKDFESLLAEKEQLEENCKDSSRLLQRNSFRILKEEEKTRLRLSKAIPQTIHDLKLKLQEFETTNNKPLLIEGKIYYDVLIDIEDSLNMKPSTKRRQQQQQQQQRSLSVSNRSAPPTALRPVRPSSAPSPSFIQSRSASRRQPFSSIDETPVRRGVPTASTLGSSLRLNKASVTTLNDLDSKRKPLTPTSQILSPAFASPERKRMLSPSRATVVRVDDGDRGGEPPHKKLSGGLKSPIRTIGIPLAQPTAVQNRFNILPNLKYGSLQYGKLETVKSPVQLSSSDISDADDDDQDVNKENNRNRYRYVV